MISACTRPAGAEIPLQKMFRTSACRSPRTATLRGGAVRVAAHHSPPSNPLGVHALVFSGGWDRAAAEVAIAGAARNGYSLIEGEPLSFYY